MVIDDLADRKHECDLLLDQTLGRMHKDYSKKVDSSCKFLFGPQYSLLRNEFKEWRKFSLSRRKKIQVNKWTNLALSDFSFRFIVSLHRLRGEVPQTGSSRQGRPHGLQVGLQCSTARHYCIDYSKELCSRILFLYD